MASDANLVLQASVTKTASFNGTGVSLRQPSSTTGTNLGGTPRRGMVARVTYSSATTASGTATATFSVDASDDNSAFSSVASGLGGPVSFSGATGASGVVHIPFNTDKPWARAVLTLASGTSPSITYAVEVVPARP
jgi:hypothetical protein